MRVTAKYLAGASVRQWIRARCLALHLDRWLDSASHRDYGIIFMYSYLEIVTQQESPAVSITRTHYDARLMRMWSLQGGRVTVKESISCYYTVYRYGEYGARRKRDVSQVHGGEVLVRSSCARLARVLFVLVVSIAMLRLGGFDYETRCRGSMTKHRRRGKKRRSTP